MSIPRLRLPDFLTILAAFLLVHPSVCLPSSPEFLIDTWRLDDDLPRDGIHSIAQGVDGYLWLSSRYGLARFDGARFVNVGPNVGAHMMS